MELPNIHRDNHKRRPTARSTSIREREGYGTPQSRSSARRAERERRRTVERAREASGRQRPEKQSVLKSVVNGWWSRLYATILGDTWDEQGQLYASGNTKRDYVLNTAGLSAWGMLFPMLTIVASQLVGAENAGQFNMAFTTATLLLYIGNYGVKTFQVSDIEETESFASYQLQRVITCVAMILIGIIYCLVRGYTGDMLLICAGAFGFRAVDALADVYESRMQQQDKLYLAGISQAVRSIFGIIVFSLLLLITRSLVVASIGLAVAAVASFVLLTLPLTLLETTKSRPWSTLEIREIFVECFPTFLALFLFALIESVPKYAMEGVLPYESQVYFSAIYFPAQAVLMIVGFIYKPQLVKLANIWSDSSKRARFDLIVLAMIGATAAVTIVMAIIFQFIGVPLNSMLYGVDFAPYRAAQLIMIVAGGMSAAIDFLYQIITVLRQQQMATRIYIGAFVFVTLASIILVRLMGFDGAVWSYFLVMVVLLIALVATYLLLRAKRSTS